MTASAPSAPYYDPYDFEIDNDPHSVWKRLRDECPLYYNDKHDFWALSRWDDVEAGLKDHTRLISGRGTVLELIKSERGDAPGHDLVRRSAPPCGVSEPAGEGVHPQADERH